MWWRKKQPIQPLDDDAIALILLKASVDVVKRTSKVLKKKLPRDERFKLQGAETEMIYFFAFAIDYWSQKNTAQTQEQTRSFGETWASHLRSVFYDEPTWQVVQERFIAYGQIANENDDAEKLFGFTTALADYCDLPLVMFVDIVPTLLFTAMRAVQESASYRVSPDQ